MSQRLLCGAHDHFSWKVTFQFATSAVDQRFDSFQVRDLIVALSLSTSWHFAVVFDRIIVVRQWYENKEAPSTMVSERYANDRTQDKYLFQCTAYRFAYQPAPTYLTYPTEPTNIFTESIPTRDAYYQWCRSWQLKWPSWSRKACQALNGEVEAILTSYLYRTESKPQSCRWVDGKLNPQI
jgi:hypothetical protein